MIVVSSPFQDGNVLKCEVFGDKAATILHSKNINDMASDLICLTKADVLTAAPVNQRSLFVCINGLGIALYEALMSHDISATAIRYMNTNHYLPRRE